MTQYHMETIGCDISDKKCELCIIRPDGSLERPKAIRTTPTAMRSFFARPEMHVVIEVGGHSRWIKELLTEMGHRVTVANARRLKLITASDSKNDRTDAELLARLGRADPKLLAPIEHRGRAAQADLAAPKARDLLVATRTKLVNHVRATVKSFGERLPKCRTDAFHLAAGAFLPESLKPALEPIIEALAQIDAEISRLDRTIADLATKHPDVELLMQVPGVGVLTSLVYVLTIEDKNRFKKSRMAGAYFGLRPRQDQSGMVDKQLGITKAGDPFMRRLLVQCANHILRQRGADTDLRRWGLELCKRGGKNAKRRATVAVARKLAVLMHRLWVTGEVYEPIGYSRAA